MQLFCSWFAAVLLLVCCWATTAAAGLLVCCWFAAVMLGFFSPWLAFGPPLGLKFSRTCRCLLSEGWRGEKMGEKHGLQVEFSILGSLLSDCSPVAQADLLEVRAGRAELSRGWM